MFKKPSDVDVSRSSALGGKDVKKFTAKLLSLLPRLDAAGFDDLFPGKAITKTKLSIGAVIYVNADGNPIILDPSNDHFDVALPTIYALAHLPQLIPSIEVNASAVSSTMMRGSDLFLQGVNRDAVEPSFLAGQVCSVRVPGNNIPFAVGTLAVSFQEADAAGWSGRGLLLKHVYGDELWQVGDKLAPNVGFQISSVGPQPEEQELSKDLAEKASLESGEKEPCYDDLIMNIVVGALKAVKSGELPITVDGFVTTKMVPLKPHGMASLDLKKSKWKRAAKLLDACADLGMCSIKNVRKEACIVEINRQHEALEAYKPLDLATAVGKDSGDRQARVRVFFKSPTVFLHLLGLEHKSQLICEADVDSKLKAYSNGTLDTFLLENLYGKKERETVDPRSVSEEEIRRRFLSKLTKQTIFERIDPGTGNLIQIHVKGELTPLKLSVLRRTGRLMTVVSGFEDYGFAPKELAESLAKRLKTNAFALEAAESKSGKTEVCLLGDWISKRQGDHHLPTFFQEGHGLSKAMLVIDTRKK